MVHRLLNVDGVDFLALGEISAEDVACLKSVLAGNLEHYEITETQEKAGLSNFDTALIHRKGLVVTAKNAITTKRLERTSRVAQRFDITTADGSILRTFVSHWPSRATFGAPDAERLNLGNALRTAVGVAFEESLLAPLILIGDFNDEPFDYAIDFALLSSRDRALVKNTPQLLYNPFWRHMSSYEIAGDGPRHHHKGTYYYAGGQTTRWHTFDQMMFSSSTISGDGGWILDEPSTKVLEFQPLLTLIEQRNSIFDHLPIIGRLVGA